MPKQYGMVIDLQKCTGCGACAFACKAENNTQAAAKGQTYNWADFIYKEEGQFPKITFTATPVLCNHCTDAPCVDACPVKPKAMFKTADGITMHNDARCIGCRRCQKECPYSSMDVKKDKAAYSVISYNPANEEPHAFHRDKSELIKGCTDSAAVVAEKAGALPPSHNKYSHPDYGSIRRKGVVEKCIFCEHRVKKGQQPNCVAACPSGARVFGDLKDPANEPAKLLKKYKWSRLKEDAGTSPNVYYIRNFGGDKKA
jgi:Fe-S-cluster-containing dehydrogenase component